MTRINPKLMVGIAFIMLLLGVALPLMMHVIPSTFFLNLMAYLCSFFGIIIGFIGAVWLSKQNPH
jgi:hypothetical protein